MRVLHKTKKFKTDILALDNSVHIRAKKAVDKIQENPELGKPLGNVLHKFFSEHFGRWRIIYKYDDENVYLLACSKRKKVYK